MAELHAQAFTMARLQMHHSCGQWHALNKTEIQSLNTHLQWQNYVLIHVSTKKLLRDYLVQLFLLS
jgi:hypothetical protein